MLLLLALVHAGLLAILVSNLLYLRRPNGASGPAPAGGAPPRVSVLIPARNEEANLQRLLPSLLAQDYADFEVIVYDDGSEDGTWDVIQRFAEPRLRALRGSGPPPGWIGKVHALYQATRSADGAYYLFLDADVELADAGALGRLADRAVRLGTDTVLTGLTRLRGGGLLLVSLVPNAILTGLPWALATRLPLAALGALNGQCWMIRADLYRRYEPHEHLKDEVLEDVEIGRYLKSEGLTPVLVDVQPEVSVYMYRSFAEAWQGFRKNAYLILGGTPLSFIPLFVLFVLTYLVAPFLGLPFLASLYLLKGLTDRRARFPLWVTLLAPLSFLLSTVLQLHSAFSHWTGRVAWKGRRV